MKTRTDMRSDGITASTQPTFEDLKRSMTRADAQTLVDALRSQTAANSFDSKVAAIETAAKRIAKAHGIQPVVYGTPMWYACALLQKIDQVRDARRRGLNDLALASAVDVGRIHEEMSAKGWPIVTRGRAIDAGSRRGAGKRGSQIMKDAAAHDADIYRLYDACPLDEDATEGAKHKWVARHLNIELEKRRKESGISDDDGLSLKPVKAHTIRRRLEKRHLR